MMLQTTTHTIYAKGVRNMARATKQPAAEKPATTDKPANKEAKVDTGVGIKELSAILGRTPKSTRASIRRIRGGAQVGQGSRYRWDSTEDPEFVSLVNDLTAKKTEE
jgi:hypothetical protein